MRRNVAHGRQEACAGEDLRSKATPAPSWLRVFVRDIPGGVQAVYLYKARTRTYTRALIRAYARSHTRARTPTRARLAGFNSKPVRV